MERKVHTKGGNLGLVKMRPFLGLLNRAWDLLPSITLFCCAREERESQTNESMTTTVLQLRGFLLWDRAFFANNQSRK